MPEHLLQLGSNPSNGFFEAPLPGCAIQVRVEHSAIQSLHAQVTGAERIGLLLGSSTSEAVHIERCELLPRADTARNGTRSLQRILSTAIQSRAIQATSLALLEKAPEVVGFFRTQTTGSLGATKSDRDLATGCFPSSGTIFLVIQTAPNRPWLAALTGLGRNAPANPLSLEFPIDQPAQWDGSVEVAPVRAHLPFLEDPAGLIEIAPEEVRGDGIRKSRWLIAALLGIALAGGAGIYSWSRSAPDRTTVVTEPLALKAIRNGKDFDVSWNRTSKGIRTADSGTLTIRDGPLNRTVQLNETQLREGRYVYGSLFEELDFRLEVLSGDLRSQAESVKVLTWSAKPLAGILAASPDVPDSLDGSEVSQPSPR